MAVIVKSFYLLITTTIDPCGRCNFCSSNRPESRSGLIDKSRFKVDREDPTNNNWNAEKGPQDK